MGVYLAPHGTGRIGSLSHLFKDTTHGVSRQGRFAPTTRLVEQAVQSQRLKTLAPTSDRRK
jgi:hypothetical protein